MAGLPEAVEVKLKWDLDLNTQVRVWEDPPLDLDGGDLDDWHEAHSDPTRWITLGDLIAEKLITGALPGVTVALRARADAITEDEIRSHVRGRIAAVMGADVPGGLTAEQLTLAARIEREYRRQLTDPSSGGFAHGTDVPVVTAIIATAVRNAFHDLAPEVVAEIRARCLAEIGQHARADSDPIPPGG
jgi:hypothetical protein